MQNKITNSIKICPTTKNTATSWSTQSHPPNTGWVTQMTLTVHGLAHAIEPQMWGQKGVEQSRAGGRATRYQSRVDPNRGRAGNVWKAAGRQKTALLAFDQAGVTRVTCIQTSSAWVSTLTCEKIDQSHLTYVKRSKLPSTNRCIGQKAHNLQIYFYVEGNLCTQLLTPGIHFASAGSLIARQCSARWIWFRQN